MSPALRLIRADSLSPGTAQTTGMVRTAAISGDLVGAQALWMGRTVVRPGTSSGDHHHGESETGIYAQPFGQVPPTVHVIKFWLPRHNHPS